MRDLERLSRLNNIAMWITYVKQRNISTDVADVPYTPVECVCYFEFDASHVKRLC